MSLLSSNLKAFIAIVKNGTVHGAASELLLTQTAITQRIRVIESELHTTLFTRSRKGMILTQEGQALLRYCKGALELEGQAFSHIYKAGINEPVFLTLAGPTSVLTYRVSQQLINIYEKWPNLFLNLILTDTEDRLNLIKSGQASLAIVSPNQVPNETESKILKPDRYILVASSNWKGRKLIDILSKEKIIDFYESDQTTINYLKHFNLYTHVKRPRLFINNNEILIQYFKCGIGYGTLTQEIAKPYIESGELVALNGQQSLEDQLALIWYKRPEPPIYFQDFIKCIK